jgi:GTP-binding protein
MPLPRIAIVGRPNVGKSSLLNMLAGAKVSIVDPTPGVTRDRIASIVEFDGPNPGDAPRKAEVVDTGGYGVYVADGARYDDVGEDLARLSGDIERQIGEAVRSADLILFVLDAQTGVTALDQTIADLLRKRALGLAGKRLEGATPARIVLVANKTDGEQWDTEAAELGALGFGEPLAVSALTNFRRRQFTESLYALLPEESGIDDGPTPDMKIAFVGKRNAGKSTFVNALAGEPRVIVSEIAGTTRDAIDVRVEQDGHAFVAIDTAGFRKRGSIADDIEHWALHRALRSIRRADVVVLLLDATAQISQVDKQLSHEIQSQFKPCVIVVNKWDLAAGQIGLGGKTVGTQEYQKYIEKELRGLTKSPIVFATANAGVNVKETVEVARELHEQARHRVPTGQLNQIIRHILESRGPSSKLGTKAKVLYVAQVAVAPPTIVMVVNQSALFTPEYERYMLNRLAEETPFTEVPIRLVVRDRTRARPADLESEEERAEPVRPPKMPRVVHGLADEMAGEVDEAEFDRVLREIEREEA